MPSEISGVDRLKQIVGILTKHNVVMGMTPQKLCAIIEELGPTFVKLGQIMSMRPDMIPAKYCEELQKLRADVTPMPPDEVRRVVEKSLQMPLEKAFPTFDFTPLGSASIAQAHKAVLADGSRVVVKVQREGIHDKMESDIALLRKAAVLLKLTPTGETVDFGMVLDEMWVVSQEEMNFITEAKNIEDFQHFNADVNYVACPKVYRSHSSRQVLVMEEIDGVQIDDVEALKKQGYDLEEITRKLCMNYMKQILDDGFFHADPHPGNILIRDGRIVWIDLGMVGRLSARDQKAFKKAAVAAVGRDTGGMVEAVLQIGKHNKPIDREVLFADVDAMLGEYMEMDIADMDLGAMVQQVLELAKKHRISMPPGVTMLGRGLATIEGVVADVCPTVNMMELMSQRFAAGAFQNIDWKKTAALDAQALYDSARKSLSIPALISDTLRAAQKGELKLRMEQTRDPASERSRDERARHARATAILCAGLVSSALTTLSGVEPRILGVPWVAAFSFAVACGCAAWCLWGGKKK